MKKVNIFIVNFNSAKYIAENVQFFRSADIDQVYVFDNHSSKSDRRYLKWIEEISTNVQVVWSPRNIGFGAGINELIKSCRLSEDSLIWILNPDVLLNIATIHKLLEAFESSKIDILSPLILTGNQSAPKIWFGGGKLELRRGMSTHLDFGQEPNFKRAEILECSFITGAAPLMKLSTWIKLGGFRNDLFLYWEDADLSMRANRQHLRLGITFNSTLWHEVGGSLKEGGKSAAYFYYMQRNRLLVLGEKSFLKKLDLVFFRGSRASLSLLFNSINPKRGGNLFKFVQCVIGIVDGFNEISGYKSNLVPIRHD